MCAQDAHRATAEQMPLSVERIVDPEGAKIVSRIFATYREIGWGRAISVIIMFGGMSLFFRLVQVAVRMPKVGHACPSCGLQRHEPVKCKACGQLLAIADKND